MQGTTEDGLREPLLARDLLTEGEKPVVGANFSNQATLVSENQTDANMIHPMNFGQQGLSETHQRPGSYDPSDSSSRQKSGPSTPGVSGPLSNSFFAPTGDEIDLERQIGNYSLCYRKLAIYTSDKNKLYILAGSQDFSNEDFQVLIIHGFRSKDDTSDPFKVEEAQITIKRGQKDRKVEFLEYLRNYFDDYSISFSFKSFGIAGFMKFEQVYHAIFVKEISQIGKQDV